MNNKRIEEILNELKSLSEVSTCAYNNDGLFNEINNLKVKLNKELDELRKDK